MLRWRLNSYMTRVDGDHPARVPCQQEAPARGGREGGGEEEEEEG